MNAFEAYAERTKQAHERRAERLAARRQSRAEVKRHIEKEQLRRQYRAALTKELEELLGGRHGAFFRELVDVLDQLTLANGRALLPFLSRHDWASLPTQLRFRALQLVDQACIRARERGGLPPFDDPLPWDGARPFVQLAQEVLQL
jgi:hypothetical protein